MFVEALGYGKGNGVRTSKVQKFHDVPFWTAAPKFVALCDWFSRRDADQYYLAWIEGRSLPLEV